MRPAPVASSPSSSRRPRAIPPPREYAPPPSVVVSEFAVTSARLSTTDGRLADSPDSTKRLMLTTTSARPTTGALVGPSSASRAANSTNRPARVRLPRNRTCCRRHRSRKTPAKGPTTLNGSSSVAKPTAASCALVAREGSKNTALNSAVWNSPSAHWPASRMPSSRRRSRTASSDRNLAFVLTATRPELGSGSRREARHLQGYRARASYWWCVVRWCRRWRSRPLWRRGRRSPRR